MNTRKLTFGSELHIGKPTEKKPDFRGMVEAVRSRLSAWQAYHDHQSCYMPSSPHTEADEVADAIYRARKPILSNRLPDPELNLRVSDQTIESLLARAIRGERMF
ncbi:MAG: hypothetical protein AABX38_07580 [Candidatus Micrarchaeota archaeon]